MDKELKKEFEEKFAAIKAELKFKSSLEELEKIFFLKDFIAERKYVSENLSRQLCARIVDLFNSWYGYLHGIMLPNPQSMINVTESQMFNEKEKKEIMRLMNKIIGFTSTNTLNGLLKDKAAEAKFIDDAMVLWNEIIPKLVELMTKVNKNWKEKRTTVEEKKKPDTLFG